MLTITNQGAGFKVLVSHPGTSTRGFSVQARSIPEIHEVIDHYHGGKHKKAHWANSRKKVCPLCRKGE